MHTYSLESNLHGILSITPNDNETVLQRRWVSRTTCTSWTEVPAFLWMDKSLKSVDANCFIERVKTVSESYLGQFTTSWFQFHPEKLLVAPKAFTWAFFPSRKAPRCSQSTHKSICPIDHASIRRFLHSLEIKSLAKNVTLTVDFSIFPLHKDSEETVKVLKQHRKMRRSIPMLGSSRSKWVVIDEEYNKEKRRQRAQFSGSQTPLKQTDFE